MWFADIFFDAEWVAEREGLLGEPKVVLCGAKSQSLGIDIDFRFFGDDTHFRHVRVLMHTDDKQVADRCINLNIQTWVASIEVAVMLETNAPFHVFKLPGSETFTVMQGQRSGDERAAFINIIHTGQPSLDYLRLAGGMQPWGGEMSDYLFYLRRLIDSSMPLDVRWLNGYRLLEWHFVQSDAGLPKSSNWREFIKRFEADCSPLLRVDQSIHGLFEEARALAAHAGIDDRTDAERIKDPRNAIEKTFRVLERMVATVLNEHPSVTKFPVKFVPFDPAEQKSEK
jgi:hypothetical protein